MSLPSLPAKTTRSAPSARRARVSHRAPIRRTRIMDIKPTDHFKLSETFVAPFSTKPVSWGPVGYFTYKRTYARPLEDGRSEEWHQTVRRVVEGTYTIQKWHCNRHRLPWSERKAQRSAQEMFRLIFEMKFLPPGRGLWTMGTEVVEKLGSAALMNCAFHSTDHPDFARPYTFVMDMSMLGVGCLAADSMIMTAEGARRIDELAGHPFVAYVNGEPYLAPRGSFISGTKKTVDLTTREGYQIRLTDDHRLMTPRGWVEAGQLRVGDKVDVNAHGDLRWNGAGNWDQGYLLGILWGDGYFARDARACVYDKDQGHEGIMVEALRAVANVGRNIDAVGWRRRESRQIQELSIGTWVKQWGFEPGRKKINAMVEGGSYDFVRAFLRGAFDTDGGALNTAKGKWVKLFQSDREQLQAIQRMLLRLGIYSVLNKRSEAGFRAFPGRGLSQTKPRYQLTVTKESLRPFAEKVGFSHQRKAAILASMKSTNFRRRVFQATIESIESAGTEQVWDITVDGVHAMDANGFVAHNCGFDTNGAGKFLIHKPRMGTDTFVVDDSREGWVSLVRRVLNAYIGKATMPAAVDYSEVRLAGTPIKSFGGISSGPEPLMRCVERIKAILDPLARHRITAASIVDIMDVIGVCVVSGNVRRSALLSLGQPEDRDFLSLKDPELHSPEMMTHRWASNNSVFASVGMDYRLPAAFTAKNGEPGFFWLENARNYGRMKDGKQPGIDAKVAGLNPCGEQNLESGELCCLVETFPAHHADYEEYEHTLKFAYLYAKTVTLALIHDPQSNRIQLRNRRIGLSQSGIAQSFTRHGRHTHFEWCDRGYRYIRGLDTIYSDWLAVPKSKKTTTVKPAGTTSLLPQATPGMHFEHAEYYYRTIRVSKNSHLVDPLRRANYRIEDDLYDPSSLVVYFPVHARYFERSKDDLSMWEQLEIAAQLQYYWSDNSCSVTVTFRPDEAKDISKALELYETRLKSVSFLPLNDHGYVQAPYITIDRAEFEKAVARLKPLNLSGDTHEREDAYCDGDKCEVEIGPLEGEKELGRIPIKFLEV